MKALERMFKWQGGTLEEFTAKARKIFLLALPLAVLFWAFGLNFSGGETAETSWINAPLLISASAFIFWIGGELLLFLKRARS